MRGFHVVCVDGPANGFDYYVSIPPSETIHVAPNPAWAGRGRIGKFMRVLGDEPPWPGQAIYKRGEIDKAIKAFPSGDPLVEYQFVEMATAETSNVRQGQEVRDQASTESTS